MRVKPALKTLISAHYAAWVYPEASQGGDKVLKVVKFADWADWGYGGTAGAPMAQVNLSGTVTNTWHTLKLTLQANQIQVFYDSQSLTNVTDTETNSANYATGGISLDMYEAIMSVTNVIVTP